MYSQVKFEFVIGRYNGTMGMKISYNDKELVRVDSFDTDTFVFTERLEFPGAVIIDLFNKNPQDTLVDAQGTILADKYIKLEQLSIDRVPLHILSLVNLPVLNHHGSTTKTNYWGFNGQVTVELSHPDSFLWHLEEIKKKNIDSKPINS